MPHIFTPNLHQVDATNASERDKNTVAYDGHFNLFQFVEYDNAASVSVVPGEPLGYTTTDQGSTVTGDLSRSAANQVLGFAMGSLSPTNLFGWACVRATNVNNLQKQTVGSDNPLGFTAMTLTTNTTVAAGNILFWAADHLFGGTASPGTGEAIGQALDADSGSLLPSARIGWAGA